MCTVYIRNLKSRRCPGRSPSPGACGLLPAVGDGDRPGVGLCGWGRWAEPAANAPRMRIAQPPGRERKTTAPRASAIRQEEEAPAKRIQRGVDARRARWPGPPAPARREIRLPRRRSHEDTARFLRKNLINNTHTHTQREFSSTDPKEPANRRGPMAWHARFALLRRSSTWRSHVEERRERDSAAASKGE